MYRMWTCLFVSAVGPWKTAGYHVVASLVLLPKLLQDGLGLVSTVSAPKSLRGETA